MPDDADRDPRIDPWLDPESLRESKRAGREPREHVLREFELERERLRAKVREFRRSLEERRRGLQELRTSGASDDALAAQAGNMERLRGQLGDLIRSYQELERRRDQVLRDLPGALDAAAAVAEVERFLRDESPGD